MVDNRPSTVRLIVCLLVDEQVAVLFMRKNPGMMAFTRMSVE
jgi:hypothetical protein